MIERLLIGFLGGFGAHQMRPFVNERVTHRGWNRLVSYALGVTFAFPFVLMMALHIIAQREIDDITRRDVVEITAQAYFMGFLGFGAGTAAGWMIDE